MTVATQKKTKRRRRKLPKLTAGGRIYLGYWEDWKRQQKKENEK